MIKSELLIKRQVVLLGLVIGLLCNNMIAGEPRDSAISNLTVIQNLAGVMAKKIIDSCQISASDTFIIRVAQGNDSWIIRNAMFAAFRNYGCIVYADKDSSVMNAMTIQCNGPSMKVQYDNIFRDGLFGTKKMERRVFVSCIYTVMEKHNQVLHSRTYTKLTRSTRSRSMMSRTLKHLPYLRHIANFLPTIFWIELSNRLLSLELPELRYTFSFTFADNTQTMTRMKTTNAWIHIIVTGFLAMMLNACGSSDVTQNISAEDRFEQGKIKFQDEDYLEAINEFEIIKLQFPGSAVADDAQFYLAESHFNREEFLLAGEEYQALKRNMPASEFVPQAQYQTAMCYYSLSPNSPLDQRYTARAIDEFQTFIEYNPTNKLVPDAEAKIKDLNMRLSKKIYDTAVLYMKMEYYKAATMYFSNVFEKYHDTPYAEPAQLGKAKALVARKKYAEAKVEIEKFLDKYSQSDLKNEAESLRQEIEYRLKSKSAIGTAGSDTHTTTPH